MSLELGRTTVRKPPFKYVALARVGFSDTDAQGIVYYGRYLPYFDLARVEYARHLGLLFNAHEDRQFVMRAASVEYLAPARFDDLLEVFVRARRIGRTSLTSAFAVHRVGDDTLMCVAHRRSSSSTSPAASSPRARGLPGSDPLVRGRRSRGGGSLISTADTRRGVVDAIERYVSTEPTAQRVLERTAALLHERFERYSWVGFYLVEDGDLVLAAWQGPQETEHVRIRIGEGICGAAAASGRPRSSTTSKRTRATSPASRRRAARSSCRSSRRAVGHGERSCPG